MGQNDPYGTSSVKMVMNSMIVYLFSMQNLSSTYFNHTDDGERSAVIAVRSIFSYIQC